LRPRSAIFTYNKDGIYCIIGIYVDDITGGCNNEEWLAHFKSYINNLFKITDLGELSPLLGLEINQTGEYTTISQQKYIKELLHRFEMTESSTQDLPLNPTFKVDPTTVTDSERCRSKGLPIQEFIRCFIVDCKMQQTRYLFFSWYTQQILHEIQP
jgi:hypothetical protein